MTNIKGTTPNAKNQMLTIRRSMITSPRAHPKRFRPATSHLNTSAVSMRKSKGENEHEITRFKWTNKSQEAELANHSQI